MFDCEIVAKMQECQTAADARKVELVGAKDFEAAARWRDVSLALGRAIEYAESALKRLTGNAAGSFEFLLFLSKQIEECHSINIILLRYSCRGK
jgi:hypothetical protein